MATPIQLPMTNQAFADHVGCTFTMASRLKNGRRLPSLSLFLRIAEAFDLPEADLGEAYRNGPDAFGEYLREHVFTA